MRRPILLAVVFGILGVTCARGASYDVEAVKKAVKPLVFKESDYPEAVEKYFKYYRLDIEGVEHMFGSVEAGKKTLVSHVFRPAKSKGTVLLVHGYYDHAGIMARLIEELVAKGYTVAMYDQPGHGLSEGARADIGDFSEYVAALRDFTALCAEELDGPFYLVGHSLGGAAVCDYVLTTDETPFDKVILMAPLIRSAAWRMSGFGHAVAGSVVDSVPRVFRRNSSDKRFLKFMKNDPLQAKRVPMGWLEALRDWNKRVAKYQASDKPVKVIQGTKDTTVSWKYNMKLLKRKFTNAEVVTVEGAGHQLMNESEKLRGKVFEEITGYLQEE